MPRGPTSRRGYARTERVSDVIHRILAKLLCEDFTDPRIGMITISRVEVTPNLASAKIYVTVYEQDKAEETIKILNEAQGYFRKHLAKAMDIRVIPQPRFVLDVSTMRGGRVQTLLDSLRDEELSRDKDKGENSSS